MESNNSVGPTTLKDRRSTPIVDSIIRQVSKAELLVGHGQVDEAISTLKEILRLNPDSTHAHMKLKDVFLRAGMRTQAADECIQLARICESQGEMDAAKEYIARARLLSPATAIPSSTPPVFNVSPSIVHPSTPTGSVNRSRQPEPELRTSYEAPRATSRPKQPIFANNSAALQENAGQAAKNPGPPVAAPILSGPAPQSPAPEAGQPPRLPRASIPSLPIDRGSPPSTNHPGDLRESPSNGKPSMAPGPDQIAAPVSLKALQEIHLETVSADSLSLVVSPLVPNSPPIQASMLSIMPSAKLIVSSRKNRGRARSWLYVAAAALCLSAAGVAGSFWYDAHLNKDYTALNRQYEAIAQASAVAPAQADIIEYVSAEEIAPAVEPEAEDAQPTKREQDSLDVRAPQTQPTAQRVTPMSEPPAPQTGTTVAALRPEAKQTTPPPPMTSQVTLPPAVSQAADSRTLSQVGTGMAGAPAPVPPPASPPPAANRVMVAAEATSRSQPSYPRAAAMAGVGGSVAIQVSINERGAVVDARAVSGPPMLRDAALNAARRWRFTPSTIGGVPVKATKTIVFNFKANK